MDPAGEVAQLAQRVLGAEPRLGEQLAGALWIVGQLLLRHAEAHPERDQPRLRAVVQVALDPAQLGVLGVRPPRPVWSRASRSARPSRPGRGEPSSAAASSVARTTAMARIGHTGQK